MNKKYIFILSILAVIIFILGAQLATADTISIRIGTTEISFLPLVITSRAADPPPGVLYVFSSTETTDGNAGGLSALGPMCQAKDPDSHPCNYSEVSNAWENQGIFFEHPFQPSWIDWTIDLFGWQSCNNWITNTTNIDYSSFYIFQNATGMDMATCDNIFPIACCKWMP